MKKYHKMPTDEEFRERSKKRYQAYLQETAKRRALVGYTCLLLLFCVSFYVAFNSEMMAGAGTYSQESKVHNTQNASLDQFWLWKAGGTIYNKTYCWYNTSAWAPGAARPAPAKVPTTPPPQPKSAPPAPPPPPPAEDPTNYTTTGGNKKAEEPTNYTTTGGKTNTADGPNGNTTGTDSETDSPSTVLRVLGDVAVFAGSFVGYACYFFATQG